MATDKNSMNIKRKNVIILLCIAYVLLLGLLIPIAASGIDPSPLLLGWLVGFPVFFVIAVLTCRVRYHVTPSGEDPPMLEIRKCVLGIPTSCRDVDLTEYSQIRCDDVDPSQQQMDVTAGLVTVLFGALAGIMFRRAKYGKETPSHLVIELVPKSTEAKSLRINLASPSQPTKLAQMIGAVSGLPIEAAQI